MPLSNLATLQVPENLANPSSRPKTLPSLKVVNPRVRLIILPSLKVANPSSRPTILSSLKVASPNSHHPSLPSLKVPHLTIAGLKLPGRESRTKPDGRRKKRDVQRKLMNA
jgi:hypothetical protein